MNSFFKFLSRNRLYTVINLLGLSVSLAALIIIANFVVRNLTTDAYVENAERIYAISNENYLGTGYWNGQYLQARYPEIEKTCGISTYPAPVSIHRSDFAVTTLFADSTFFEMFSIRLIEGDAKTALASRQNAVITQSFAQKIFGKLNPIGMPLVIKAEGDAQKELVITGIMPDLENSIFKKAEVVTPFLNLELCNSGITGKQMSNAGGTVMFLQERAGSDLCSKTDDMCEYFKTYFWPYSGGSLKEVRLLPFKSIYFANDYSWHLNKGNWSFVVILLSIGMLILLFSIVNYVNLTVAQTGFRAKEMATRRLLGSSRKGLFGKLILESLLMSGIAFILGFLLAVTMEPFANQLLQSQISILKDINGFFLIAYAGVIGIVAILSGIIPAWIISNFRPIEVVKGVFRRKSSMVYGKILITFQNILTIALIAGSITMMWQMRHLLNAPMGYSYQRIIDVVTEGGFKNYGEVKAVIDELKQHPFVESVAQSLGTPVDMGNNHTFSLGRDRSISFQSFMGDSAFFHMMNIRIKTDHNLAEPNGWFLNEYAFKKLELPQNCPSFKYGKDFENELQIAGIISDFRVGSVLDEPTAARIRVLKNFESMTEQELVQYFPWNILIKISPQADPVEALNTVKKIVQKVTGLEDQNIQYLEDRLKEMYQKEQQAADIVLIFTIIAILISSLGLLAMSTYFIQQRRMEMAVRKVFGSTRTEVLNRVIGTFMKMVGIAFVIAVPVIWYLMNWWLEDYAYRIALSPLIFLGAGLISSLIALLTVFWQSSRAAGENPVDSLKRG